jgi:hypothetical protein
MIDTSRALRRVVGILEAELADTERRADETRTLLDQLRDRAGIEPTKEVKRRRRRRKRRRRADIPSVPPPSPMPAPAITAKPKRPPPGAVQFAKELEAVTAILQRVDVAKAALAAAKTAEDKAAISKATEDLLRARSEGGVLLKELAGRLRLPPALLKAEKRAWRRAAEDADAKARLRAGTVPKAEKERGRTSSARTSTKAKPAEAPTTTNGAAEASRQPAPKYPKTKLSEWRVDAHGVMSRELRAEGAKTVLEGENFQV